MEWGGREWHATIWAEVGTNDFYCCCLIQWNGEYVSMPGRSRGYWWMIIGQPGIWIFWNRYMQQWELQIKKMAPLGA